MKIRRGEGRYVLTVYTIVYNALSKLSLNDFRVHDLPPSFSVPLSLSLSSSLFLSPPPSLARAQERFRRYTGVAARLILTTPDRGSALLVSSASETHKTGTTRGGGTG